MSMSFISCNIFSSRYSHPQRRLFTISALLHIRASSTSGMIFTLQSDESSLAATKTGQLNTPQHPSKNPRKILENGYKNG